MFELNESLHDAYLKNNEDNHKLIIQNEKLLENLQDTCFSSYISNYQMVDCLEDSHDIVDHEKFGNLNVIDALEYLLKDIQTLDVVEEELELSLDEGYAIFKEEHDSSTLEPIYDKGFTLLKELHNPTPMDPSNYDNFALTDHLSELFLSPTYYTCKFCSSHPNEVW